MKQHMYLSFQTECGCQFTSKLEGMFKDMTLSQSTNEEFRNHISNNQVNNRILPFFVKTSHNKNYNCNSSDDPNEVDNESDDDDDMMVEVISTMELVL